MEARSSDRLVTLADLWERHADAVHTAGSTGSVPDGAGGGTLSFGSHLFRAGDLPTSSCRAVSLEVRPLFCCS